MSTDKTLAPITFEDADGAKYAFTPQHDITALDAVMISQLFTRMTLSAWQGPFDWQTYIRGYKLTRHFTKIVQMVGPLVKTTLEEQARKHGVDLDDRHEDVLVPPATTTYRKKIDHTEKLVLLADMPAPDGYELDPDHEALA